jgi:hypothetical protein
MCLTIVQLLFLLAGVWSLISGKLPPSLFRLLFGKGQYELGARQARLFGLFLISPLPLSVMATILLLAFLGSDGTGPAMLFEISYTLIVAIAAIIIARRARQPEVDVLGDSSQEVSLPRT